ncbi:MAG: hypothetical protein KC643_06695 [Nitrospira sp.]|nr:hypothetical protein [Nitrospira sp.]
MGNQLTFQSFDKFQRKQFADRLTTVIAKFYLFHDEAFALSLNAKFGSGKTTFLKMWQNQLKEDDFTVMDFLRIWTSSESVDTSRL